VEELWMVGWLPGFLDVGGVSHSTLNVPLQHGSLLVRFYCAGVLWTGGLLVSATCIRSGRRSTLSGMSPSYTGLEDYLYCVQTYNMSGGTHGIFMGLYTSIVF